MNSWTYINSLLIPEQLTRMPRWRRLINGISLRFSCFPSFSCLLCGAFSGKWVIPSGSCVCGEELHDPTAWLISDHYPISALHSGDCAFVLAFISIASCTTRRLLTWPWSMRWKRSGRGCPAFWSNAVGVFLTFFFLLQQQKQRKGSEGREEGYVQWATARMSLEPLWEIRGSLCHCARVNSSLLIKKTTKSFN